MKYIFRVALIFTVICMILAAEPPCSSAQGTRSYRPDVLIHLKRGSDLLEQRAYEQARKEFQAAIQIDPQCPDAYNNLGLTYYRVGDLKNASENYRQALEIEPLFIPSLSNLAAVRYQQRKYGDAANLYRLASRLSHDKDAQLQYNLANVLRDDKDYGEAKVHYREAIKLNPNFAAAHNGLGATYYCLSEFDKAEFEVKKAISLNKSYSLAYYHLGLIHASQNRYQDALKAYKLSLKHEKNKNYAKDTKKKIEQLSARIAQNKSKPIAKPLVVGKGSSTAVYSLIETGQYAKAEQALKALVEGKYIEDPSAWNIYGYSMLMQRTKLKAQSAIGSFRKSLELSEGSLIEAHYNLAQAFKATGKWLSAKQQLKQAIIEARKQEKMCPLVHNLHGIVLKHSGDLKGAESAYRVAIAQSLGRLPVAHYNRAIVLEKLNRSRDAVKEYKNYLRDAPQGANAKRARKRLLNLGH